MSEKIDHDKIAEALGAEYVGKVESSGGYFGALQLAAQVKHRFRVPPRGGRATNPEWTERRLVPLSASTLKRLEKLAEKLKIAPLQVAGLLLEQVLERISENESATADAAPGAHQN